MTKLELDKLGNLDEYSVFNLKLDIHNLLIITKNNTKLSKEILTINLEHNLLTIISIVIFFLPALIYIYFYITLPEHIALSDFKGWRMYDFYSTLGIGVLVLFYIFFFIILCILYEKILKLIYGKYSKIYQTKCDYEKIYIKIKEIYFYSKLRNTYERGIEYNDDFENLTKKEECLNYKSNLTIENEMINILADQVFIETINHNISLLKKDINNYYVLKEKISLEKQIELIDGKYKLISKELSNNKPIEINTREQKNINKNSTFEKKTTNTISNTYRKYTSNLTAEERQQRIEQLKISLEQKKNEKQQLISKFDSMIHQIKNIKQEKVNNIFLDIKDKIFNELRKCETKYR